jgi:hypothetical protein
LRVRLFRCKTVRFRRRVSRFRPKHWGLYKNYLIQGPYLAVKPYLPKDKGIYRLRRWQDGQK